MNRIKDIQKIFTILLLFFASQTFAQVAINEDATDPDNSAMLDIKSTHMGLLIPRMNFSQMYNIERPATGLLIFNTSANIFYYYDGEKWRNLANKLENDSVKSLNVNETLNIKASETPKKPKTGDLYMDNKTKTLRCWNGTEWKDLW
jgi:hypothetical protein